MKVTIGQKFRAEIEDMVQETGVTYLDAITDYCAKNNIEIETIARLVRGDIKDKLHAEALATKMVKE